MFVLGLCLLGFSSFKRANAIPSLSINGPSLDTGETLKEFEIINKKLASVGNIDLNTDVFSRDSFKNGFVDPTPTELPKATNLKRNNPFALIGNESSSSAFDKIPAPVATSSNFSSDGEGESDLIPSEENEENLPAEETAPSVIADGATDITTTSAKLNGSFDTTKLQVSTKWFEWGDAPNAITNKTTEITHTISKGAHKQTLTGLTPDTLYYFVMVVKTKTGEILKSQAKSFTTSVGQN